MPISGRRVFDQLREAHERAQEQVQSTESDERSLKSEIEHLVADRGVALLELAKHGLPDLRRETIQSTLQEIRAELLQIADRKDRTITEWKGRLERLHADENGLARALTESARLLGERVQEQTRLQGLVQAELNSDPHFTSLSRQAVQAEAELNRDEKRVADVLAGAQEKLPRYEKSSLFQYLSRRGFETPQYSARGWSRRIDRWVAKLIGYTNARRGYEFLKKTPGLMQAELERRRSEFHQLMSQVEGIESAVSDRIGLTAATQTVNEINSERARTDKTLSETRQSIAKVQAELAGVSQEHCQFYRTALDRYRAFLEETQTVVLDQHAQRTPSPQDDEIVSRIRDLTNQIARLKPQLQELASAVAHSRETSDGLEFIVRRMRQSNFDEERSHFTERLNLEQLLSRYQARALSRDAFWTEIKENQEFERTPAETTVVDIISHPVTQVLAEAMVHAVGAALQSGVNRSLQRRSGSSSAFSGPRPSSGGEYRTVDRF